MKEKIIFLVNPNSGTKKKKKIPKLIKALIDKSIFDFEVRNTLFKGEATQIVTEKLAEGYRYFVAVGGDGTINEIAKALINTDATLAIIPVGSGNGLARHLKIPLKPSRAIKVINKLKVSTIDYGTINNAPFFCTCGVGFDAIIGARFDKSKQRGLISYIRIAISEFFRFKPEKFTLSINQGESVQYSAFLVTIANASQYGNNAFIAPMALDSSLDILYSDYSVTATPTYQIRRYSNLKTGVVEVPIDKIWAQVFALYNNPSFDMELTAEEKHTRA